MLFNYTIGIKQLPENSKVTFREAARAVIFKEANKLLLVHNSNGDYKFPGGGLEKCESFIEALEREVLEETGIYIKDKISLIGTIKEHRCDNKNDNIYFSMQSNYYLCFADIYTNVTRLSESEKALNFTLEEVDIVSAYEHNRALLEQGKLDSPWLEREVLALKYINDNYSKLEFQYE